MFKYMILNLIKLINYGSMASHFTCSIWHGGLNTSRHASLLEGGSWDTLWGKQKGVEKSGMVT